MNYYPNESDLFTANDYALITRLAKKIIVNNLVIMTTDENISDLSLLYPNTCTVVD